MVNSDMVWKLGELQSVYNEIRFYVESASPCTNLLKFCLLDPVFTGSIPARSCIVDDEFLPTVPG